MKELRVIFKLLFLLITVIFCEIDGQGVYTDVTYTYTCKVVIYIFFFDSTYFFERD